MSGTSGIVGPVAGLRTWPALRWLTAVAATAVFAIAAGAPTDVIPNPVFHRVVPVTWWSYPALAATALLGGLITASYIRSPATPSASGKAAGGGLLSALAIGCPACNKLVILALGTTGALSIWAPLQPLLAAASIALLTWALRTRLAGELACPVPVAADVDAPRDNAGCAERLTSGSPPYC